LISGEKNGEKFSYGQKTSRTIIKIFVIKL
jgi:hypothetical protein